MTEIRTVGVIGAGQMGVGIAQVVALSGYEVLLNDVSHERVEAALGTIQLNLERKVARGIVDRARAEGGYGRIRPADTLDALRPADLIIEAATENEAIK